MKTLHYFLRNPGVLRRARTWRNDDVGRFQSLDLLKGHAIVPEHAQLIAHLAEVLNQVVGERIVVIDNENHNSNPRWASWMARRSAPDLLTVSLNSPSGIESATIPPPA